MNSVSYVYLVTRDTTFVREGSILVHGEPVQPRRLESADELLEATAIASCSCAVVDVTTAMDCSRELERMLASQSLELPVVAIVQAGDVQTAVRVIKAGAVDVLERPISAGQLGRKIEEVLAADSARRSTRKSRREIRRRLETLSAGERAVLEGVVAGKPNKCIASQLGFSLRTIELWRRNVMTKLDADSVAELVKLTMQVEPIRAPHIPSNGQHHPVENLV